MIRLGFERAIVGTLQPVRLLSAGARCGVEIPFMESGRRPAANRLAALQIGMVISTQQSEGFQAGPDRVAVKAG